MQERTFEVFDTNGYQDRSISRYDDFSAMADHLRREGFRVSVTNFSDLVAMIGYLPTRKPFYFDAPMYGEAGLSIGRVSDEPFVLVDGELKWRKNENGFSSWFRHGVVWKRSVTDERRDWMEADEAEKVFKEFVQLYRDGAVSMPDDIFMPRVNSLASLIVEKIAEMLDDQA